jgi:hypothetical protein
MSDHENPYAGVDVSEFIGPVCRKQKSGHNPHFYYFLPSNSAGDIEAYHAALMNSETNPMWYMDVLPENLQE